MPFTGTDKQRDWLVTFTGGRPTDVLISALASPSGSKTDLLDRVNAQRREAARLVAREATLGVLRKRVETLTTRYTELQSASVKTTTGDLDLISSEGQHEAYGVWSTSLATETPEWLPKLQEEAQGLANMKDELVALHFRWERLEADGTEATERDPLFGERDIESELYTPLVRQLLFPEDQVADRYSGVQRMVDATNERYFEELRKSTYVETSGLQKAMPIVRSVTSTLTQLIGSSGDVAAAFGDKGVGDTVTTVKNIASIAETVINTTATSIELIDRSMAADAGATIVDGIAAALKTGLTAFLPKDLKNPSASEIGNYVGLSVSMAGALPKVVSALTKGGPSEDKILGVYAALSEATIKGMGLLVVEGSNDREKANVALTQKVTQSLVDAGVQALRKGQAVEKFLAGDRSAALQLLTRFGTELALGVVARAAKERVIQDAEAAQGKLNTALTEWNNAPTKEAKAEVAKKYPDLDGFSDYTTKGYKTEDLKDYLTSFKDGKLQAFDDKVTAAGAGLIPLSEAIGATQTPIASIDPRALAKGVKELAEQKQRSDEEALETAMNEDAEAFRRRLAGLTESAPVDHLTMLMADIQKERMVLQIFQTAGSMAFSVAAMFFAPMAAGGTLISCIQAARKAVVHFSELKKWRQNQQFATNAVSPYLTSAMNFVDTESVLADHATAEAVIQGIKFAAEVVASAGTGTPVGAIAKLVSTTASAASTLREIIQKQVESSKVEAAWKVTSVALRNPKDRVSNLKARKLNPTLAKYSIAWGATVGHDVVALEMMNTIGLTREVLEVPEDRAQETYDKLVAYLELRYDEHSQIRRPLAERAPWTSRLPKPAVNSIAWSTAVAVAVKEGGLDPAGTVSVSTRFEKAAAANRKRADIEREVRRMQECVDNDAVVLRVEIEAIEKALNRLTEADDALSDALGRFKPMQTNATTHDDMAEVVEGFHTVVLALVAKDAQLSGALHRAKSRVPTPPPPPDPDQATVQQLIEQARQMLAA